MHRRERFTPHLVRAKAKLWFTAAKLLAEPTGVCSRCWSLCSEAAPAPSQTPDLFPAVHSCMLFTTTEPEPPLRGGLPDWGSPTGSHCPTGACPCPCHSPDITSAWAVSEDRLCARTEVFIPSDVQKLHGWNYVTPGLQAPRDLLSDRLMASLPLPLARSGVWCHGDTMSAFLMTVSAFCFSGSQGNLSFVLQEQTSVHLSLPIKKFLDVVVDNIGLLRSTVQPSVT